MVSSVAKVESSQAQTKSKGKPSVWLEPSTPRHLQQSQELLQKRSYSNLLWSKKEITLQVDASLNAWAQHSYKTRYANIERELLAVVYGCENSHTYLLSGGANVIIFKLRSAQKLIKRSKIKAQSPLSLIPDDAQRTNNTSIPSADFRYLFILFLQYNFIYFLHINYISLVYILFNLLYILLTTTYICFLYYNTIFLELFYLIHYVSYTCLL